MVGRRARASGDAAGRGSVSHVYQAVGWSPQKRKYDLLIALCTVVYLGIFTAITMATQPHVTFETLLLRATGSLAFVMLSFILLIGPLARISPRFLPVLYNRRHLGVATFLLALVHGAFAVLQFHALGDINPLASVLSSDGSFGDGGAFPFQPLGMIGLGVLFLMAATSHDFWLANLTPTVWKGLHMAVYGAYAVLLGHVALGALQGEGKAYLWPAIGALAAIVFALHLYTGLAERRRDRATSAHPAPATNGTAPEGYLRTAVRAHEIPDAEGRVVTLGDERVAVFRNGDEISCISNVCRHQMGPLGEGRIIDGCITCPWHGFQYDPVTGCAPPPFDDRAETYDIAIQDGLVWINPVANPLGTASRTARLPVAGATANPPGETP
ncbi:MAG: Rieske 2Fe-2S domain-containing protein [Gemmatimonadetes bacterium]|nr:Rieske 2Fe-2S domain-containing protein [Gemmatimonadota bacterium]MYB98136.1 Rieske 2Fe-2S domain-containing protein [Gemmatimonadota bacterium]MYH52345.1 Rieske 2Fe-2S domain-containing protein [Gemmatimonadota bacterium]MYK65023.1 Rieske 2Fe-2S domain-containing protein [Gemmatimonadota bacterium]